MKILLATPLYPPAVGGPANYAKEVAREFRARGEEVAVVPFGNLLKFPTGVRHVLYFFKLFFALVRFQGVHGADAVLALDAFSAAIPAAGVAKMFGKKFALRTGGDFLWEMFVERTKEKILLSEFYDTPDIFQKFSRKEKIIFRLAKWLFRNTDAIIFSTQWQRDIFVKAYGIAPEKTFIVGNAFPQKEVDEEEREAREAEKDKKRKEKKERKNFLWAGRDIVFKNIPFFREAFALAQKENPEIELDIFTNLPRQELFAKMRKCYAVVMPSLSEVSPNFILEAMAFDTPFLLTMDTGMRKELGLFGVFFDPRDREDMKRKILFLADEKNHRAAKEKLSQFKFSRSYAEIAGEILEILKEIKRKK